MKDYLELVRRWEMENISQRDLIDGAVPNHILCDLLFSSLSYGYSATGAYDVLGGR